MKHLPVLVGIALLTVLLWSGCQESQSHAKWAADTTRVFQGVQAREDSAALKLREADSLTSVAESLTALANRKALTGQQAYRSALHLRREADSLLTLSPDTSVALYTALQAFDSLRVGYDSLNRSYGLLVASNASLKRSNSALLSAYQLQRESVDSLVQLVRRAPEECRFLSIPCPRAYLGVGVMMSDGVMRVGPSVGLGVRIPF